MPDSYREPIEEKEEALSSVSSVSTNSAEQEILELERKLAAKKASLRTEKDLSADLSLEALAKGEALAKVEKPLEQILGQEKAISTSPATPASTISASSPTAEIKGKAGELKRYEKTQQLKSLIDLAFQKGISYAVDVVREMDNPFLMDELHDVLIDELRKELIERGKLEEI